MVERPVEYPADQVTCRGFLAYDDALPGRRPGVLVIHEWWGLNDYARSRARQLAQMGYVALAADMYGEGKVAQTREEAAALAGAVRGGPLMRSRAVAAFEQLLAQPNVDPARTAAIGFCFGGTAVLELAYSGAAVGGVVSFHGGLAPPAEEDLQRVRAKFLILHGAEDRAGGPDAVRLCLEGLNRAGADWQLVVYSGAVHAFTNPDAGNDPSRGAAFHEAAARRSWAAMQVFFEELFGG